MRIAALCAGAALTALALQPQAPERVTVPFSDASRPRVLQVTLVSGNISVTGYSGTDAVVETTYRNGTRARRLAPEGGGLKVEERDNTVRVSSGPDNLDVKVQVPFDTALRLKTVNGNITVEGTAGEIDANCVNGGVTLSKVSGAVVAHSLNADVRVDFDKAPEKAVSFSTLNGDVDVTMPAGTKARVKMKTGNGEIHSDFEIQLQPEPGPGAERPRTRLDKAISGTINGGGPEMQFTTFNGKIHLRRR